jgi:hypothetical protein
MCVTVPIRFNTCVGSVAGGTVAYLGHVRTVENSVLSRIEDRYDDEGLRGAEIRRCTNASTTGDRKRPRSRRYTASLLLMC